MNDLPNRIRACYPIIERIFSASGCPGLSLGVFHDGIVVHTGHFGVQDATKPLPPNDDTLYRIASLTKAMMTSVVAILVEEGVLAWDTPIREYLSDFSHRKDAIGQEATLRDVLSNRTGLARSDNSWGQQLGELVLSKKEEFRITRHIDAVKPFRSGFAYSQWNYILATEVVEQVTGRSIESLIVEKIHKPLGLERTTFGVPPKENAAKAHAVMDDGTTIGLRFFDCMDETAAGNGGAWGCKSSVKELLSFYKSMLSAYNHQKTNDVDTTPGSPFKLLCTVFSPHTPLNNSKIEDEAYCLGLNRIRLPRAFGTSLNSVILGPLKTPMPVIGKNAKDTEVFFHNGTFPGSMASVFLIPSCESAVVLLSNSTPFMDATDFIGQMIVSLLLGEEPPTNIAKLSEEAKMVGLSSYTRLAAQLETGKTANPPQYPLDAYEGIYWNAARNIAYNVQAGPEGSLQMTIKGLTLTRYDLLPYDGNTFYWRADRGEELKKGMYPITSLTRHKITFSSSGTGKERIDVLAWHHDPVGKLEMFRKRGHRSKAYESLFKL